jgi:hypothetical protein
MNIKHASIIGPLIRSHARARIRQDGLILIMQVEIAVGAAPTRASLTAGCDLPVRGVGRGAFEEGVLSAFVKRGDGVVLALRDVNSLVWI